MKIDAKTTDEYFDKVPSERKEAMNKLRKIINTHLPKGFEEQLGYGMPSWVVPHSIYPKGYHCTPQLPLPFISIASQKNFIALYHMGMYAKPSLLNWWTHEFPKYCSKKLDMGKSCIRFKKVEDIPYTLVEELCQKMTVQQWIELYESHFVSKD
jgi:uncharacterized protein YdhG (YjbR/CyaY superfamily)